ncbi:MAG TPA: gamma-glutamyltransferase family protein [Candidatus Methylomirabilis sp.]|nr:gamma-glutamyltransferase family protein [Candidatus Methylomirabilis sp.]
MSDLPISGSYRPSVMGMEGVVASGHYLASLAAQRILDRGGNAVDAGVAAGLCTCVLQTDMVDLAGVAPIIIYLAEEDRVVTISGLGRWPRAASVEYFQKRHGGRIPVGVERTITPGAPDAWITALERFGTMSLADVMQDAITLAERGFPMHHFMASNLMDGAEQMRRWDSSASIFLPGGRPPQPGEVFVQKDLGRTMRRLIAAEARGRAQGREAGLRAARELFYQGEIAREIASFYQSQGGLLDYDDLASFHAQVEEPVRVRFHEYEIYTCGPWCQGPVLAQALSLLAGYDLRALGLNSPAYVHLVTEALKLAFADRERYYGDPEFVEVPMEGLLSEEYAAERRRLVHLDKARPGMPPAGVPGGGNGAARPWRGLTAAPEPAMSDQLDTSYLCVVDRHGNIFSATPSDGCTQAPVVPGTGLVVSTRGSQSWAVEGHASAVAPGKRPRLTPCPAMIFKHGKPYMPIGTPGGDVQCQAMLQVFLNVAVFGLLPQAAIEVPRFATYSYPGSFEPHAYQPDELRIERRLADDVGGALTDRGHKVATWPDWTWKAGGVCAITIDRGRGVLAAGADPRRTCYAIGW